MALGAPCCAAVLTLSQDRVARTQPHREADLKANFGFMLQGLMTRPRGCQFKAASAPLFPSSVSAVLFDLG